MAQKDIRKIISRAASSGGSSTYREARPWGFYTILLAIALLGVIGIYYSRYQMQHPVKAPPPVQPTVGTTWQEAIGFFICNGFAPSLPPNKNIKQVGIYTTGNNIIVISPKNSSEAGNNATLAKFVSEYPGLILTNTQLELPHGKKYVSGGKCPDSHEKAVLRIYEFKTLASLRPILIKGGPAELKLANNAAITVYYGPPVKAIPSPPAAVTLRIEESGSSSKSSLPPGVPPPNPAVPLPTSNGKP